MPTFLLCYLWLFPFFGFSHVNSSFNPTRLHQRLSIARRSAVTVRSSRSCIIVQPLTVELQWQQSCVCIYGAEYLTLRPFRFSLLFSLRRLCRILRDDFNTVFTVKFALCVLFSLASSGRSPSLESWMEMAPPLARRNFDLARSWHTCLSKNYCR